MFSKSFIKRFRKLDAHAKTLEDFRVRTVIGGTVTFISIFIILLLVVYESFRYITPEMKSEIIVDGGKMEKMPILFDITFPYIPCYILSLDIMDESGEHITEYDHDVYKERLDKKGEIIIKSKDLNNKTSMENKSYCGPCYGANLKGEENPCCNSCEEIQKAYAAMGWTSNPNNFEQCIKEGWKEKVESEATEGCRMYGLVSINKLRGNFHFSVGKAVDREGTHIHDMTLFIKNKYNQNFKHKIDQLQFGSQEYNFLKQKRTKINSIINPLDNTEWGEIDVSIMYQYFLKIVPTEFNFLSGKKVRTFQYSVSKLDRIASFSGGLPGVFFMFNHSPMRIIYSESRMTTSSYFTSLCAILGGVFSVASILDSILYRAKKLSFLIKKAG